jgi:hypothetical protein
MFLSQGCAKKKLAVRSEGHMHICVFMVHAFAYVCGSILGCQDQWNVTSRERTATARAQVPSSAFGAVQQTLSRVSRLESHADPTAYDVLCGAMGRGAATTIVRFETYAYASGELKRMYKECYKECRPQPRVGRRRVAACPISNKAVFPVGAVACALRSFMHAVMRAARAHQR